MLTILKSLCLLLLSAGTSNGFILGSSECRRSASHVKHSLATKSASNYFSNRFPANTLTRRLPCLLMAQENTKDGEEVPIVLTTSEDAENIDGSLFEDAETGKPPDILVMKELLGINIFTYILAGLIAFFLSMNFFIGPGWLGQVIGIEGTGSITNVSDSFPDTVDLSSPEFKLDF